MRFQVQGSPVTIFQERAKHAEIVNLSFPGRHPLTSIGLGIALRVAQMYMINALLIEMGIAIGKGSLSCAVSIVGVPDEPEVGRGNCLQKLCCIRSGLRG